MTATNHKRRLAGVHTPTSRQHVWNSVTNFVAHNGLPGNQVTTAAQRIRATPCTRSVDNCSRKQFFFAIVGREAQQEWLRFSPGARCLVEIMPADSNHTRPEADAAHV